MQCVSIHFFSFILLLVFFYDEEILEHTKIVGSHQDSDILTANVAILGYLEHC